MTTINDIPGDTPAEQRDWLFRQWYGVSEMLDKAIAQRDELRKAVAALKSEIELLRVELGNRPSPGQKPVDVWPDRW